MSNVPTPSGIITFRDDIPHDAVLAIRDQFAAWWAGDRSKPLILAHGAKFRQFLPDGTLEPVFEPEIEATELTELEVSRDWLPYVIATFGWIVALAAVIVR